MSYRIFRIRYLDCLSGGVTRRARCPMRAS